MPDMSYPRMSMKLFSRFFSFPFSLFYSSVLRVFALPAIGMDCSRSGFCMFFFMINKEGILKLMEGKGDECE